MKDAFIFSLQKDRYLVTDLLNNYETSDNQLSPKETLGDRPIVTWRQNRQTHDSQHEVTSFLCFVYTDLDILFHSYTFS